MDPIWERHVRKLFPNKEAEEGENWYHCYKVISLSIIQQLHSLFSANAVTASSV
jgi:hypothetical protein